VTDPPTEPAPLEQVWQTAVDALGDGALSAQHRAWVGLTRPLGLVEDTVLLAAPNEFAKDVLDSRLRPVIAAALSTAYGRAVQVAVTVQPSAEPAGEDDGQPQPEPLAPSALTPSALPPQDDDDDRPLAPVRALPGTGRDRPGDGGGARAARRSSRPG
jgi:chromosomal replication initiator protein